MSQSERASIQFTDGNINVICFGSWLERAKCIPKRFVLGQETLPLTCANRQPLPRLTEHNRRLDRLLCGGIVALKI
jgi:hypothetical protein